MGVRVVAWFDLPDGPWADVDVQEIHDAVENAVVDQFGPVAVHVVVDPAGEVIPL